MKQDKLKRGNDYIKDNEKREQSVRDYEATEESLLRGAYY